MKGAILMIINYISDYDKGIVSSKEINAIVLVKSIHVYNHDEVKQSASRDIKKIALILVDIMIQRNLINQLTYDAIIRKYGS